MEQILEPTWMKQGSLLGSKTPPTSHPAQTFTFPKLQKPLLFIVLCCSHNATRGWALNGESKLQRASMLLIQACRPRVWSSWERSVCSNRMLGAWQIKVTFLSPSSPPATRQKTSPIPLFQNWNTPTLHFEHFLCWNNRHYFHNAVCHMNLLFFFFTRQTDNRAFSLQRNRQNPQTNRVPPHLHTVDSV